MCEDVSLLLLAQPGHHDVQGQGGNEGIVLDLLAILQRHDLSVLVNACDLVLGSIPLVLLGQQLGHTLPDGTCASLQWEPECSSSQGQSLTS